MRRKVTRMWWAVFFSAVVVQAAEKQASPAIDHAAMGHGAPTVIDGPWSYKGRKNPEPFKRGRWEMVPVPGYGHMHIDAAPLSPELRCAALRDPRVMVDRATRTACGLPSTPAAESSPPVYPGHE